MLTIKLRRTEGDWEWQADIVQLPGTPPVGVGHSKEQAVAHLFLRLSHDGTAQERIQKLLRDGQWGIAEETEA
jgi:hypothetical protein